MSSLRRDLIERRLWPIVIILIAAIVAVPFLVGGHKSGGSASMVASAPPVSDGGAPPSGGQAVAVSDRHQQKARLYTSSTRNPFESALASSTKAQSDARKSSTTSTTATTPANTDIASTGSDKGSSSSSSGSSSGSSAQPSTSTTTTQTSTTTSTQAPTSPSGSGPWTIHEASAVVRGQGTTTAKDLARLTPLPSAATPTVMYIGLSSNDREAVFALATGVDASGRGQCLPSKTDCALIGLANDQKESFIYLLSNGTERTMTLTATLASHVTSTASDVSAALAPSQIGLCEVELGDPIQFSYDDAGAAVEGSSKSACQKGMKAVPFPGTGSGQ